jgi:hypothetical protein
MSGGKGGSSTQKLPGYLKDFQKRNIARGENLADIGYMPYTGPEIAAVNQWEEVANLNQNQMSGAFNMGTVPGSVASRMPETVSAGGVEGYSSFPVFQQAVEELRNVAPDYDQRYRENYGIGTDGSIYGDVGGAPVDLSGMNNSQILNMALNNNMLEGMSDGDLAVLQQMASSGTGSFASDAAPSPGFLTADFNAQVESGDLHPAHAARLQAIQRASRQLQSQGQPEQGMGEFGSDNIGSSQGDADTGNRFGNQDLSDGATQAIMYLLGRSGSGLLGRM